MTYLDLAIEFAELVRPHCVRVEVGGSIRRGKPDPKDIEIVAAPDVRLTEVGRRLFDPPELRSVDMLDRFLDRLVIAGTIERGRAWGPRYKQVLYKGAPVDLFSVLPPAQWGVIFAIRTGSAEFGKLLVTSRLQGGFMPPDMRVAGGVLWREGGAVETPEEEDYFREIGVPCWPPEERSVERLNAWRRGQPVPVLTSEGGLGID